MRSLQAVRQEVQARDAMWTNEAMEYSAKARAEHVVLQRQANVAVTTERARLEEVRTQLERERDRLAESQRTVEAAAGRRHDADFQT